MSGRLAVGVALLLLAGACCFQVVRVGPGREPLLPRIATPTPTPPDDPLILFEVCCYV